MKIGRRSALLALIAIVVLIVVLTVAYFAVPLKTTYIVKLRIEAPGSEIFLDDQKVGVELAEIELTGNEDCLIPISGITKRNMLNAIAPMGRVMSYAMGAGYTHSGGDFPISGATHEFMMRRADNTVDSIVFIAVRVESLQKTFAIPIRVKQGPSCAAKVGGTGVSGSRSPFAELYDRVVRRRRFTSVLIRQTINLGGPDRTMEQLWWLDSRLKALESGRVDSSSQKK